MNIFLMNKNPQKEKFHNYDFSVYTASKYRDMKLDTYRRTTQSPFSLGLIGIAMFGANFNQVIHVGLP